MILHLEAVAATASTRCRAVSTPSMRCPASTPSMRPYESPRLPRELRRFCDGVHHAQITKAAGDDAFPTIMAAIVSAIDKHGDLMRMAISSPGNDFRLGACEAPPAIVSTYLGDDMTEYLTAYAKVRTRRGKSKSTWSPRRIFTTASIHTGRRQVRAQDQGPVHGCGRHAPHGNSRSR